jgi:hypothetical protein
VGRTGSSPAQQGAAAHVTQQWQLQMLPPTYPHSALHGMHQKQQCKTDKQNTACHWTCDGVLMQQCGRVLTCYVAKPLTQHGIGSAGVTVWYGLSAEECVLTYTLQEGTPCRELQDCWPLLGIPDALYDQPTSPTQQQGGTKVYLKCKPVCRHSTCNQGTQREQKQVGVAARAKCAVGAMN